MKKFAITNKRRDSAKFARLANRTKLPNVKVPMTRNGIKLA